MNGFEDLFKDAKIISKYTIADAVRDGTFTDVTELIKTRPTMFKRMADDGWIFVISEAVIAEIEERNKDLEDKNRVILYEDFFDTVMRIKREELGRGEPVRWKVIPTIDMEGEPIDYYAHIEECEDRIYFKVFLPREY